MVLVPPVALLLERVAVHVVSVALPEAGRVVVEQVETADPLHGLPEVEVGHHQPQRPSVIAFELLPAEAPGEQVLLASEVGKRQIGRETMLGTDQHVRRRWLRTSQVEHGADGHTLPLGVELAPLRDAVDVGDDPLRLQGPEFVKGPALRMFDETADREVPSRGVDRRDHPGVEHRKAIGVVLAGWQAIGIDPHRLQFGPIALEEGRHGGDATAGYIMTTGSLWPVWTKPTTPPPLPGSRLRRHPPAP